MTGIILLFAIGLVLLFFEVFVPGGVLGVLGGLFMLAGCGVAFADYGTGGGSIATVLAVALIGFTLYFELFLLPKTALGRKLFLDQAISAQSQPPPARAEEILGRDGETLTTLAPSGYVLVAGKKYEAASQSGLLPRGTAVKVTGLDNFRLLVSKS